MDEPIMVPAPELLIQAGQRRINLIWEVTQSLVAILIVGANMWVAVVNGLLNATTAQPAILSNALFLVLGFYFARTNHAAVGGTGSKPSDTQPYLGR